MARTLIKIEGLQFNQGLIPAIAQDADSGEVLMLAYMNREALEKTLETGMAWYYSRSRQSLWLKGETSGHHQLVKEIRTDCDQDAILLRVVQQGAGACHEGYRSCFHYPVEDSDGEARPELTFDPDEVYQDKSSGIIDELFNLIAQRKDHPIEGSYTNYLFTQGIDKILKKVGEETAEVIIGAKNPGTEEMVYEIADLVYHLLVLLVAKGATPGDVLTELSSRRK